MYFVELGPSFVYIYCIRWELLVLDCIENVTGPRDWFDCNFILIMVCSDTRTQ